MNSKSKIKRAMKVKAKAKGKGKKKAPPPTAVAEAYAAESTGVDLNAVGWFMRVDYVATNFVGSSDDDRCPAWNDVVWRRTYNRRNGVPIQLDSFDREGKADAVISDDVRRTRHGEVYRPCSAPYGLIDGGLSRDIVTFLYAKDGPSASDLVEERSMLVFLSPKGSRLYTSSNPVIFDTIVVFDAITGTRDDQGEPAVLNKVWKMGTKTYELFMLETPFQ